MLIVVRRLRQWHCRKRVLVHLYISREGSASTSERIIGENAAAAMLQVGLSIAVDAKKQNLSYLGKLE